MAEKPIDQNKIKFLLEEYSRFYRGVIRTEGLLRALKELDPKLILEENEIIPSGAGLLPTMRDKTVEIRIKEVETDLKVLTARLSVTKKMLEEEPGGKEALEKWVLEKEPEDK
jgi:hypothetical protein